MLHGHIASNFLALSAVALQAEACGLSQGTLYPDVIESCPPPGSGQKHSHTIKSHHNVGGLPKDLDFTLIEPLRELFKVLSLACNTSLARRTSAQPETQQ